MEVRRKFHAAGGRKTLELRVGIHARNVFWKSEEIETAYALSRNPEYQFKEGSSKGKANNKLITRKINEMYHGGKDVRTYRSIVEALNIYRKQKRKVKI